jgi:ATP-dependent exoDNAse (exonuclease V) beta subunit
MEGDPYGRPDYSKPKPPEECVTAEEVQAEWAYLNHHATFEGSTLHNYIETYMTNRIFPYPTHSPEGLSFSEIESTYRILERQFINFYNTAVASGRLIPVRSELVVGDSELNLTGMVDQLFWNVKEQCLQIWDWKTNTKLNLVNKFGNKMLYILYMLDACEFTTYSLQLSVYKRIIERNTNLKLGDSYLVWFNEENPNYEIIKCADYTNLADEMFKFKLENPDMFV